jgi:hypothetical protein
MLNLRRLTIAAIASTTALTCWAVSPSSAINSHPKTTECARDLVTEDGTCAHRIPAPALSAADRRALAAIDSEITTLRRSSTAARRTARTAAPIGYAYTSVISEVEHMRVLKEGEGNGGAWWTCGPSATRNVVAALFKHATGSYRYLPEAVIGRWEGTSRHGTGRANIVTALNGQIRRLHNFGTWKTVRPKDAIDYLFNVVVTTGMRKRPIIANVDTEFLDYFGASDGRGLDHFNIVYGSMTTKAGKTYLRVAEEYDPHRRYGSYTTSAPYGKYWVLLAHAFRAVNNTDIHGIIR